MQKRDGECHVCKRMSNKICSQKYKEELQGRGGKDYMMRSKQGHREKPSVFDVQDIVSSFWI